VTRVPVPGPAAHGSAAHGSAAPAGPHPDLDPGGSGGHLVFAQATIRFALEPETFPVFLAWLRKSFAGLYSEDWFGEELIRKDLIWCHNALPGLEYLANELGMLS